MALRRRGGKWHYRFNLDGREYSATTGLADTKLNENDAKDLEAQHRIALMEGRNPTRRIIVREFSDASEEFLRWAEGEYRAHPNTYQRIKTSFTSAKLFFSTEPVSLIDEQRVEEYKTWRITDNEVRDITVRHDLHALSKFFGYAIKWRWTRDNPIRNVNIPSDADSIRIHVISDEEEREYFKRCAKNQNLWDLARLIRNQGMRPDEVLSLQRGDVDLARKVLHVRNGKSAAARRTLNLVAESCSILTRRMKKKPEWIFPSERCPGKHILRLNGAHDRACKEDAKNKRKALCFVLYDWRHTFATRLAQAGIDLATLAAIIGHSSIRIVQRYVHPTADHKRNAMERYEQVLKKSDKSRKQKRGQSES
jgi:integrase